MENEENTILAESKAAESTNAVAIAEQARQRAHEAATAKIVEDTLGRFFSAQTDKERFVSTQRIPFICSDIRDIKDSLVMIARGQSDAKEKIEEKIDEKYVSKEAFVPVQRIVYGAAGLILITVLGAVVALVIMAPK